MSVIKFEPRTIVCSPKNYRLLKSRYPTRKVIADSYCGDRVFYVIRKNAIKYKEIIITVHLEA